MEVNKVISKINVEINAFNESGGREDKACAEGLRQARTIIQTELLKKKTLNKNQQVVLEWLKSRVEVGYPCFDAVLSLRGFNSVPGKVLNAYMMLEEKEKRQVLAAFSEWGMKEVAE